MLSINGDQDLIKDIIGLYRRSPSAYYLDSLINYSARNLELVGLGAPCKIHRRAQFDLILKPHRILQRFNESI